jgi:hypothetical protein
MNSKILASIVVGLSCSTIWSQTLSLTSPLDGDFVGRSTTFQLRATNITQQVRAIITISKNPSGNPSTTLPEVRIDPDGQGNGSGSAVWSPGTGFPEGLYDVVITATHGGSPLPPINLQLNLDTVPPKFTDFAPANNSFVSGNPVTISALIQETNMDTWRVRVNDEDIPNNTGSGNSVLVIWDPSSIEQDGQQTIKITARDLAGNEETKEIVVRLDRVSPEVSVLFPRPNQGVIPNGLLGVSFDVIDSSSNSVDVGSIIVELRTMANVFIKRVGRVSYSERNDTTARWTGLVNVTLPPGLTEFKLVITAVDKAGNVATVQEVPLTIGRGRSSGGNSGGIGR